MLYLVDDIYAQRKEDWKLWHIGDPIPKLSTVGIVYIQASENELQLILSAMQATVIAGKLD